MIEAKKLRVGVFAITGCAGCQLSVIFNEDELLSLLEILDLRAFPFVKDVNAEEGFDYVLMEGLVATKKDLEMLKFVRSHTKRLIALGACAHTGCIPAYRNFTLQGRYGEVYRHAYGDLIDEIRSIKPSPISAHVRVDYIIPGCPPEKGEILAFMESLARGIEPRPYREPVCVECRRNGNRCLLEDGKPCLGPITWGGCNAVCINGGFECWGCRGRTDDANVKVLCEYLQERGYSKEWIRERMRTFTGMILPDDLDAFLERSESLEEEREKPTRRKKPPLRIPLEET